MTRIKKNEPLIKGHPLALGSFPVWLHVLFTHGGVDRAHLQTALRISLISLLSSPLRLVERLVTARQIHRIRTRTQPPPIFIVGFWRSGTTHLHNLFTCDRRLGYVSQYQTMAPEAFLIGRRFLKQNLARRLGEERPQDNVKLGIDTPQEEEFVLSCISALSFYHGFLYFPTYMRQELSRSLFFEGVSEAALKTWQQKYRRILDKAMIYMDGKRLVLKNPPNLARLQLLSKTFPGAKFVHIHRSPFEVIPSLRHTLTTLQDMFALQEVDQDHLLRDIYYLYQHMVARYLNDAKTIPEGDLAEVSFADLECNPVAEMARIYETLDLGDFTQMESELHAYVNEQRGYRKNIYRLDPVFVAEIAQNCAVGLRHWGYRYEHSPG